MIVRPAEPADLPGILAIYNDVIATSTAIYSFDPSTLDERRAWLSARREGGYPVLVAADASDVLGFASFGEFRARPGYAWTVEHSLHVRADRRRAGIGSALLSELVVCARELGKHALVGGIDATNEASLRLHERFGFERVGHLKQVGRKFERWLDLVFVERLL
jgi:phosphinothricin acetyltransferase